MLLLPHCVYRSRVVLHRKLKRVSRLSFWQKINANDFGILIMQNLAASTTTIIVIIPVDLIVLSIH